MKLSNIFQRANAILIHPSSRTTDGVWIIAEPCVRLSTDVSDEELGQTVLASLEASRTDVPHPTNWKNVSEPLLKAAGVKTWNTFAKGALSVQVTADGNAVEVTPTANLGATDGFEEIQTQKRSLVGPLTAPELGAVVRQAIVAAR